MKALRILHLLLLLSGVSTCYGQTFSYQKFTVKDGLPHSNIFRIYQDKKGFLWLATDYGLSRYDGLQFVNFKANNSSASDAILSATESPDGTIWACINGSGLQYLKNDTLTALSTKSSALQLSALYADFDSDGAWVIDRRGYLCRLQSGRLKLVAGNSDTGFRRMARQDGNILFATDNGLYTYTSEKGLIPVVKNITDRIYAIQADDRTHTLWLALKNEVLKVQDSVVTEHYYLGNNSDISDMLVDSEENIWVAIPGRGLFVKRKNEVNFSDVSDKLDLRNILVNDLFEDRSGNIWIATHGSGLYCLQSLNIINYPVQSGTINNYTKAISVTKDGVYFGSIGTVSKYQDGFLKPLEIKNLNKIDFVYFVDYSEGTLMLGTPTGLILKKATSPYEEQVWKERGYISCFRSDKNRVWLGGFDGLYLLENGQVKRITDPLIKKRRFNAIGGYGDAVFFGTDSGAFFLDQGKYSYLPLDGSGAFPVNQIMTDSKKQVWFATERGVFIYDRKKVKHVPALEKSAEVKATHISEDKNGNIWVGTLNGLWQYQSGRLVPFFRNAELITREILSIGCDEKNNIWVGTVNGISVITHTQPDKARPSPVVYITEVRSEDERRIFPDSVSFYNPGNTQIVFSGIELPSAAALEYEYRILGNSGKWFRTNGRTLELSSLPIGNYVVEIRARRKDSGWGKPARLYMHIDGPFWKSNWFIAFIALIAAGILYAGIRWQIHHATEKKRADIRVKDKMVQLKQQALSALINPHFIFNCLNSIQSYIQMNDREQANKYLVQFSRLVRITLDHAQESFISLETEMDRISLYLQLEKLRFGDKLNYSITEEELAHKERIEIPNMVIQPYIENAIKHGIMPRKQGGNVTVQVKNGTPGLLTVIIEDDGMGITTAKAEKIDSSLHRSIGMALTKERLELLEQLHNRAFRCDVTEMQNESGATTGTRVTLVFNYETSEPNS